ncbi:hypothetical protein [Streptomyces sp. NPDC096311]|uniref:hypothetical protein n=1 Tax=Streptomyces sp. NPDC096311 TaxID=3366083 RepID=UPI003801BF87
MRVTAGRLQRSSPTDFATYTPAVTNGGAATFNVQSGYYSRTDKRIDVCIYLTVGTAGSGTGIVTVAMPSNVDRSIRQALTLHTESIGSGGNASSHIGGGEAVFFTTTSGANTDRLRNDEGGSVGRESNILGSDLLAGGLITIVGWYREV